MDNLSAEIFSFIYLQEERDSNILVTGSLRLNSND